jgi:hypothetical protein
MLAAPFAATRRARPWFSAPTYHNAQRPARHRKNLPSRRIVAASHWWDAAHIDCRNASNAARQAGGQYERLPRRGLSCGSDNRTVRGKYAR